MRQQMLLAMGTATVGSASTTNVDIPAPAGGIEYPTIVLEISAPNPTSNQTFNWVFSATVDGGVFNECCRGALVGSATYTIPTYYGGHTNTKETVLFPVYGKAPYRLAITQLTSAGNVNITYKVWASMISVPVPTTPLAPLLSMPRMSWASVAFEVLLPPSHTPYVVRVAYTGTTVVNGGASAWDYAGSFGIYTTRWMAESIRMVNATTTHSVYEFVYPGTGSPILLGSNNTPNATVFMNFQPLVTGNS